MNASAYLRGHGWRGDGYSLDHGNRGLSRPLLVAHKKDLTGLGTKVNDVSSQWWANAFDKSLKNLGSGAKREPIIIPSSVQARATGLYSKFVKAETLGATFNVDSTADGRSDSENNPGNGQSSRLDAKLSSSLGSNLNEKHDLAITVSDPPRKRTRTDDNNVKDSHKSKTKRRRIEKAGTLEPSTQGRTRDTREEKKSKRANYPGAESRCHGVKVLRKSDGFENGGLLTPLSEVDHENEVAFESRTSDPKTTDKVEKAERRAARAERKAARAERRAARAARREPKSRTRDQYSRMSQLDHPLVERVPDVLEPNPELAMQKKKKQKKKQKKDRDQDRDEDREREDTTQASQLREPVETTISAKAMGTKPISLLISPAATDDIDAAPKLERRSSSKRKLKR